MSWLQPDFLGQSMTSPLFCHRLVSFIKSVAISGSWSAGQIILPKFRKACYLEGCMLKEIPFLFIYCINIFHWE